MIIHVRTMAQNACTNMAYPCDVDPLACEKPSVVGARSSEEGATVQMCTWLARASLSPASLPLAASLPVRTCIIPHSPTQSQEVRLYSGEGSVFLRENGSGNAYTGC